jgi:REP element-mobilizing transposase RayT/type I restriction-modification system DNA methylase subunit
VGQKGRVEMSSEIFDSYLSKINQAYMRGDATEHTHRPALKVLLEALGKKVTATNEPKRVECGAPDFVICRKIRRMELPFGYIECKNIGTNLQKESKSKQLKRYFESLHNLILTDYIEFRLYVGGEIQETAVLAREGKGGTFTATEDGIDQLEKLLGLFFAAEPIRVTSSRELAEKMAGIAQLLRDMIASTFEKEKEQGKLHAQYEAFNKVLLHDLKESEFADMYAQTICYGLFAARCHLNDETVWGKDEYAAFHGVNGKGGQFTRKEAAYLLPKTNPFLRNIFGDIAGPGMDDRIAWLVDDLVNLLDHARMEKVLEGFGLSTKRIDPVVHFYETFLGKYDPKMREARGVYYTPEPVVSYIVRSVDWLLKEKFGLKKGLRDEKKIKVPVNLKGNAGVSPASEQAGRMPAVQTGAVHRCLILDPAAGTGTFLQEVIREIYGKFRDKGKWPGYVREHLLPRLFGFELMMAPYTICHMKLGLELCADGYDMKSDERLGVYLTNTLEEAEEMSGLPLFTQWLADEAREANKVKRDMPIMVVMGNPPYSYESINRGEWISKIIKNYYFIDGKPLGEKNPKGLQDDYVKFIRYGQYRIEQTGGGILAFITNHGYLDNPTFRGMRQQLMETFSDIYVLDLHGNQKKKETCPDGSKDVNVFDIQQGVTIGIFIKEPKHNGMAKVHHADLYGLRNSKYEWLVKNFIKTTNWKDVKPQKPFYFFKTQDISSLNEYEKGFQVLNILPVNSSCMNTARDALVLDYDKNVLNKRIELLREQEGDISKLKERFKIKDTGWWKLEDAVKKLRNTFNLNDFIISCLYKPFDQRWLFHHTSFIDRPRSEANYHLAHKNFSLVTTRQTKEDFAVLVTDKICGQHKIVAIYDRSYFFPLYLYPKTEEDNLFDHSDWPAGEGGRVPNLDKGFVEELAGRVKLEFVSDGRGDLGIAGVSPAEVEANVQRVKSESAAKMAAIRGGVQWRDRGYLPHWEKEEGIYHVTFRLADSLPKQVLEGYVQERENIIQRAQQFQRTLTETEAQRIQELYTDRIEEYLDSGAGQCYLQQPAIADLVASGLAHFDGKRYQLYAWCIMPNHVHVVFKSLAGCELSKILHSWKSYTAKEANKILHRQGVFWQREYYDHLIQDEEEYYHTVLYVLENPVKANLPDWKWVWMRSIAGIPTAEEEAGQRPAIRGTFGPEDVLHYIYAVFHSPEYRRRYAEFLKIDFPRVPLPKGRKIFRKLCEVGRELTGLHLLEAEMLEEEGRWPMFPAEGSMMVEKGYPKYVAHAEKAAAGKVHINAEQYFEGVGPEVWEFHVGGYQVCEKWLKDRRGRKLDYADVCHYQKITAALGETIKLMGQVDRIIAAHGGWPMGARGRRKRIKDKT